MHGEQRRNRMLAGVLAAAATFGLAAAAQAGEAGRVPGHYVSVVVDYADLDLGSAAGNRTLYARLSSAADRACGSSPPMQELGRRAAYYDCYDAAMSRALDALDSRELQALHAQARRDRAG
jgi:UrcA family protein